MDAILTATATSDIFTQDLEDLPKPTDEPIKKKPEPQDEKKKPGRPKKEPDVINEPLTDVQNRKLRAMIGDLQDLNNEEKTDFLNWLKKEKADLVVVGDKERMTKKSVSEILDNFDGLCAEFSNSVLGVVDPPQEEMSMFEEEGGE